MKKLMKSLMLFAAAAMALTSCENEAMNEGIESNNTVTMTITANDATRTFVQENGDKANFYWNDEGEVLRVIEVAGESTSTKQTDNTYSLTDRVAEFTVSFTENTEANEFTYYAVYPNVNYVEKDNDDFAKFKVALPEAQTYTEAEGSYDANADLMIAKPIVKNAQPTALSMQFTRLVAIGKMTLKGMPEDKNITSLTFTATGKALAGRAYVDLTTGIVSEYGYQGQKEEAITLTIAEGDAINNDAVYFTCFPFELATGETFEVKAVTADKYTYTKTVTLAEGKSLAFSVGNMSAFTVNMSTAEVVAPGKEFTLLTDVSKLHIGDEIIIANTANGVALSTTQNSNNRGQQGVTIENNTITAVEGVAVLTVGKDGDFYTLYDPANSGYLYAVSGKNYLRTQATNTDAGLWTISIDNGETTIAVTSLSREMRQNNSSSIFACYASGQNAVSIFLNDINTSDPVVPTLSVAETSVALTSEASEGTVTITTENVEGDVTATLGEEYDWFEAEINAGGNLSYSASANTTEASRTATVTLSAEGVNDVVVTFTQSAPAAVVEKSTVAAFIENANETTYYELTGVVSNVANTTYGNFDLTDATGTIYVYGLYSTDGSQNKYWAASGVKEGDVITVQGQYTYFNDTTHEVVNARYISHYGFTATAASTSIEAAGGNTTITVASTGTLPEAISYTVVGEATVTPGANNTYTVTFDEYTGDAAREATITLTCGLAEQTVTITQSAPSTGGESTPVEDIINIDFIGIGTYSSYTAWSDKTGNSGAVYAGQSHKNSDNVQLRATSPSGIVTTTSGGKATKVTVTWANNTTSGRTLDIYGKNTAYTSSADLYNATNAGTKIGSIVCGTSTELVIDGDYAYVGVRSASGAMYLTDITFTWATGETPDPTPDPEPTPEIEISVENQNIANTEGEDTIPVTVTNGEGYEFDATTTADWIVVGWNNGVHYLVEANDTNAERTATVEIYATDGENEKTVSFTITQEAGESTGGDVGEDETTFTLDGTFTFANSELSLTQNGITVTQYKVSGQTAVSNTYNTASTLRVYKGHALSFTGKTITKIEITYDGSRTGNSITVNTGTFTASTQSGGTHVWTGESDNVVITNTATANNVQLRPTQINITYKN